MLIQENFEIRGSEIVTGNAEQPKLNSNPSAFDTTPLNSSCC